MSNKIELTEEQFDVLRERMRAEVRNEMQSQQGGQYGGYPTQHQTKPIYTGTVSDYGNEMGGAKDNLTKIADRYKELGFKNLNKNREDTKVFKEEKTRNLSEAYRALDDYARMRD